MGGISQSLGLSLLLSFLYCWAENEEPHTLCHSAVPSEPQHHKVRVSHVPHTRKLDPQEIKGFARKALLVHHLCIGSCCKWLSSKPRSCHLGAFTCAPLQKIIPAWLASVYILSWWGGESDWSPT